MQVLPFSEPWLQDAHAVLMQQAVGSNAPLLVYGSLGLGLLNIAQHWVKAQLCESTLHKPCGQCKSCHMVEASQHPDLHCLLPASVAIDLGLFTNTKKDSKPSTEIRIDDLRNLHDFFYTTSSRGGRRFLLVYPFEALNTHTANAFLKILEEPPAGLCMVTHRALAVSAYCFTGSKP
jgi:DNA polymerase-3 subunit delta'